MGFNNAAERKKFEQRWAILCKKYCEAGMSKEAIQELHDFDWDEHLSERRYREHTQLLPSESISDNDEDGMSGLFKKFDSLKVTFSESDFSGRYSWVEAIEDEAMSVKPLGHMYMAAVTSDDVKLAMVPVSKKSASVYRSVQMLFKLIFTSAVDSKIIASSPCEKLRSTGGIPQKEREALTDEQAANLLAAINGLPPYGFVMIGLYAGLRREEILGLQWDCVFLDDKTPYLSVRRAWHSEHNRPVISTELKTAAAKRDIPLPPQLTKCLRELKAASTSDYVISNSDGGPLSYTQFKRVWQYIVTRSTKERTYVRYVNGQKIYRTVSPVLGEKAAHNNKVVYSLDFQVTPHQLRHTYITNLIYASVDPKTVQYLAGHENSKITMDIYAKVKYNRPQELSLIVNKAFGGKCVC